MREIVSWQHEPEVARATYHHICTSSDTFETNFSFQFHPQSVFVNFNVKLSLTCASKMRARPFFCLATNLKLVKGELQ